MAMNPEVKEQWLKALRSGEYKQTKGMLHKVGGGYCCLGVLCDLAVKAEVIPEPVKSDSAWLYQDEYGTPPAAVFEWAGINDQGSSDGYVIDDLIELNDSCARFSTIADVIKDKL